MLRRFGIFLGLILSGVLCNLNAQATEINTNNYDIYVGDVNSDGYKDFYFKGKPFWLILSGDIATPIPLQMNLDFIVYGASGTYATPVVSNLTSADVTSRISSGALVLMQKDTDYYLSSMPNGQTNILLRGAYSNLPAIMLASFSTTVLPLVTQIYPTSAYPGISDRNFSITFKDVNNDGIADLIIEDTTSGATYGGVKTAYISDSSGTPINFRELRPSSAVSAPNGSIYVGSVAGQFRVDESGAANYSIPISVADGVAGVKPQVALNYSSNSGNGIAGMGWSLSGLSSIARCRQTLSQDNFAKPLSWNSDDRFCYNGQRLMVVTGSYGAPDSTYRTEIDSYVRVTAKGGSAGNPQYFTVEAKDGSTSYFGYTADSKVTTTSGTLSWAINRFMDSVGNAIDFNYTGDATTGQRINEINYAFPTTNYGNALGAQRTDGAAKISFNYVNRTSDISTSYTTGGFSFTQSKLLSTIVVNSGGTELRTYYLNYQTIDPTVYWNLQTRLGSITECKGSACFKPTTFSWWDGGNRQKASYSGTPDQSVTMTDWDKNLSIIGNAFADVDGDGLPDLVYLNYNPSTNYTNLSVKYAKSNVIDNIIVGSSDYTKIKIASLDYNADGRQDIAVYDSVNGWRIFLSTVSGDGNWHLSSSPITISALGVADTNVEFVDVDGNGLIDAVSSVQPGYYPLVIDSTKPASSNTFYKFGSFQSFNYSSDDYPAPKTTDACFTKSYKFAIVPGSIADFNGDGVSDFIVKFSEVLNGNCRGYTAVNQTTDAYYAAVNISGKLVPYFQIPATSDGKFYVADMNGDGLSDVLTAAGYYINNGNGFNFTAVTNLWNTTTPPALQLIDLNGDGLLDIVWYDKALQVVSAKLFNENYQRTIATATNTDGANYFLSDVSGDGIPDLVKLTQKVVAVTNGKTTFQNFDPSTGITYPGSISVIDNGMGNSTQVFYGTLATSKKYKTLNVDPTITSVTTTQSCNGLTGEGYYRCMASAKTTTSYADASSFYSRLNGGWILPDGSQVLQADNTFATTSASSTTINKNKIYPVLEMNGGMSIVSFVKSTAPTAGTTPNNVQQSALSRVDYFYGEAKMQARGRGFLGFGYLKTVDAQTGVMTMNTYRQDFPFIGSPLTTAVYKSDSSTAQLLSSASNKWGGKKDSVANIFQPYLDTATQQSFALNSGNLLQTSTTATTVDNYGNPLTIAVTTLGTEPVSNTLIQSTKTTTNIYGDGVEDARLGRLSNASVVTTLTGSTNTSRTASFTYYSSGAQKGLLNTESVVETGVTTTYQYDDFGNKTKVLTAGKNSAGVSEIRTMTNSYTPSTGRYLVSAVNDLGFSSNVTGRNEFGEITTSSDINGVGTQIFYDPLGQEYMRKDATGAWSRTETAFCSTSVTCPTGAIYRSYTRVAGGGSGMKYYDALGRVIRTSTVSFSGTNILVDSEYDNLNRLQRQSAPYYEGATPIGWTTYAYDILGRPLSVTTPDGSVTTSTFSDYDTIVTNSASQNRTETRNAIGQLAQVKDHLGGLIQYSYNTNGDLLTATTKKDSNDAGIVVKICYDLLGRKIGMLDPDKGGFKATVTSCPDPTNSTALNSFLTSPPVGWWTYQYDDFGELIKQTDPKGQSTTMTYDITGRMLTRTDKYASGTIDLFTKWYYDINTDGSAATGAKGKVTGIVANNTGNISCNTTNSHCTNFYYDNLTRPIKTSVSYPGSATSYVTLVNYDDFGRAYEQRDPLQGVVLGTSGTQTHYNQYGYAYESIDLNDGSLIQRTLTTNFRGQVLSELRGNGATSSYTYFDTTGLLNKQQATLNGGLSYIQNNTYTWDSIGNLLTRQNNSALIGSTASATTAKNVSESFYYDGLNRLIKTTGTSAASSTCASNTQDVSYDGYGNITCKNGVGNYGYGTNAGPHAVTNTTSDGAYTYDANGNQISGVGRTLDYTSYDMAKFMSKGTNTTEFSYGPDRARWQRKDTRASGTTVTTYIGNIERIEVLGSGSIEWKRYVGGGVYTYKTNSSNVLQSGPDKKFIYNDHLGSLDVITDSVGKVTHSESFDAWGARRSGETWNPATYSASSLSLTGFVQPITNRGFTGHEMVDDFGIIHMNGRIYDSKLGRFLQADSFVDGATDTQGYNRYTYVRNNPMNKIDPSGHFWNFVIAAVASYIASDYGVKHHMPWLAQLASIVGCVFGNAGACAGARFGSTYGSTHNFGMATLAAITPGSTGNIAADFLVQGTFGGISSEMSGGSFKNGFVSAGLSSLVGNSIGSTGNYVGDLMVQAVAGGTISEVTGGKFANGARSSAFSYVMTSAVKEIAAGGKEASGSRGDALDRDSFKKAAEIEIEKLESEGLLPKRNWFQKMFGLGKINVESSFAEVVKDRQGNDYAESTGDTSVYGVSGRRALDGFNSNGEITIYRDSGRSTYVEGLGQLTQSENIRFTILHEIGHDYVPSEIMKGLTVDNSAVILQSRRKMEAWCDEYAIKHFKN